MHHVDHGLKVSPDWVLVGGCVLTALAAALNADFMLRVGVSISHLTGDLSRITSETVKAGGGWSPEASALCASVFGFVGGATTSGFLIHHPALQLNRPYGRSLAAVGVLFLVAGSSLWHSRFPPCLLAAWGCGMQNALATRYRGIVLRTTHITGLLTDFGQNLGMKIRGLPIDSWKVTTPLLLAISFGAGALVGAWSSISCQIPVTRWCGVIYVVGGVGWSLWKRISGSTVPESACDCE